VTDQDPVALQAEDGAPNEVDSDLAQLYDHIQKTSDERDQIKDQLLRTMADFQNFRKRVQDEKRMLEERAGERVLTALLPVLDNFERSLAHVEAGADPASVIEGVKAIERQLRTLLESQKLVRIVSVGQPFDPDKHEALATVDSAEHEEGTVVDEIEAGYMLGDRVIRPARVRVTKKP
jgi:molecular chaperone GrpE